MDPTGMMLAAAFTANAIAIVGLWLRVEHRLATMEADIKWLKMTMPNIPTPHYDG